MYTYSLHHYHAIGDAELQINGITVLAGINGSGKSTLSRWLYYVVNAASHFDEFMFHQYQSRMMRRLRSLRNILREVVETSREQTYMMDALRAINRLNYREEEVADEMTSIYDKVLIRFSEDLQEFFTTSMSTLRKQRVRRYLDLTMEDDVQIDTILESFMEKERRMARSLKKSYLEKITQRSLRSLQEIIMERYDETDKMPYDLQFSEEGVDLLSDTSIGTIFNLERAIYVDTPMAVMETSSENVLWNSLLKMMREPNIDRIASENEKASRLLLHRITRLLGGDVRIKKDDFDISELHYIRKDGLDIRLDRTATGFKTLAYLQRLLENGYLDSHTLLMIDEPEAHLHPQWIVEFAHLLILLNKKLGVKVLIASHNPDMVSAIRQIAQKEEILDKTRFYLAQQRKETMLFDYKDLGQDIEEIFKSFNIALTRIAQYGDSRL